VSFKICGKILVPINKKAAAKIAIIKAIDDCRTEHPYRPPYEAINYPPPTPVQKPSFHYGTDDYYDPSPSTSSASQNGSSNVNKKSVATPPLLTPTESESDDSILSEGSITNLF
jgi:hypothetical protein